MNHPYLVMFKALRKLDERVSKAVSYFNQGRMKGLKLNYPFQKHLWVTISELSPEDQALVFEDSSACYRVNKDIEDYAARANQMFLRFIVPSENNLKCFEFLLERGHYEAEDWLGWFGGHPGVNALAAQYADNQELDFDQSERLYAISESLRAKGEVDVSILLAQRACYRVAERFVFSKSDDMGRMLARVFVSAPDYQDLFKRISRCDIKFLEPHIKAELASNNLDFDTLEMVDRAECFIQGNREKKNRYSIERVVEKLKAMGFSDDVLRKASSTKREMLCDDLGM
jgi:hypothetical protein